MLELSFLYIYPSILPLQASKTKEIVKLVLLTALPSHDEGCQKLPELAL